MLALIACLAASPLEGGPSPQAALDERTLWKLPAPAQAPEAKLARFNRTHPRLPAPSAADYDTLLHENPSFLEQQRRRAALASGDLGSAILMARLEPGSQNLGLLRDRLLALKFDGRGAEQTRPLALAYDWLFQQWSPAERPDTARKSA